MEGIAPIKLTKGAGGVPGVCFFGLQYIQYILCEATSPGTIVRAPVSDSVDRHWPMLQHEHGAALSSAACIYTLECVVKITVALRVCVDSTMNIWTYPASKIADLRSQTKCKKREDSLNE